MFLFEFNFRFFSIVALILFFEYVNICRVQKSKLYKKAYSDEFHSHPYLLVLAVFLFAGSKYIHILISSSLLCILSFPFFSLLTVRSCWPRPTLEPVNTETSGGLRISPPGQGIRVKRRSLTWGL